MRGFYKASRDVSARVTTRSESRSMEQAHHSAHHFGTSSSMSTTRSLYQMSTVVGHGSAPSAAARLKFAIATFCTGTIVDQVEGWYRC